MPPEAAREAQEWVMRAERDLVMAELALGAAPSLPEQTAYHSHQAAEKALKAFLTIHDAPFPKTHNLVTLVAMCRALDRRFGLYTDTANTLNPFATQFRYPGGLLAPSIEDAREGLHLARELATFVRERLATDFSGSPQ